MKNKVSAINFSQLSLAWLVFTLGSVVTVLFSNLFFPRFIELGNDITSPLLGAVFSMLVVSLIAVGMMPIIENFAQQNKIELTSTKWLIIYWIIDATAIWIMGRLAAVVGLGISSWLVAVMLGLAINLIQGGLMMHVVGKIKLD